MSVPLKAPKTKDENEKEKKREKKGHDWDRELNA